MNDFIREYIDYNYDSILIPNLKDILKTYYLNHQESFSIFRKKKISLDMLLEKIEAYLTQNNVSLDTAILKVISSDK